MEYDDLLQKVGEFGPIQKFLFAYSSFLAIMSASNMLDVVFVLAVPNHHCMISTRHNNVTFASNGLPIPLVEQDGKSQYSKCSKYDVNSSIVTIGGDTADRFNSSVVGCDEWSYDQSQTRSSLVTSLNLVCEDAWLVSTAYTISMTGLLVGMFVFGNLSDKIGRRKVILISVLGVCIFKFVATFSPNYIVYVIAKFIISACNMSSHTISYVLCLEMVGPSRRVIVGMLLMYSWTTGYLIVAAVAYVIRDHFYFQLAFAVPVACLSGLGWFIPESARWLYTEGRRKEGDALMTKIAKKNGTYDKIQDGFQIKTQDKENVYFMDLFKTPNLRKRTMCLVYMWFAQSMLYFGLTLNVGSIGGDDIYLNFIIGACVEIPAYLMVHFMLKFIGRKIPYLLTILIAGLALLACIPVSPDSTTVVLSLAMVGKFCVTASFSLSYMYTSELNPTVLRSVGLATASTAARIGGILAPSVGELGTQRRFLPMLVFGVVAVLAALVTLLLPETKGKSLPNSIADIERTIHSDNPWRTIFKKRPRIVVADKDEMKSFEVTNEQSIKSQQT